MATELSGEQMEALARARQTRELLEMQLRERTDTLITRLVADYRGDKLQHDKMVGAIAEIAGMKEQIDILTRTLRGAG